jgi:[ribosomal protein S18]-alanine N-acetyltransferase
MHIALTFYSRGDFETLYAIDQSCYPRGIAYSRATLREFIAMPGSRCIVARVASGDDTIVAGFIIGEAVRAVAHIITLDVVKEQRRHRIGSALLQALEDDFARSGARQVELETATENAAGVAFWQGHGYRKTGVLRGYYLGRLDAWKMRKTLAAPAPGKTQ